MKIIRNIKQEPQELQTFNCALWVHRQVGCDKIPYIAVKS